MGRPLKGQERPKIEGTRLQIYADKRVWNLFKLITENRGQNPQRSIERVLNEYLTKEAEKGFKELGLWSSNGAKKKKQETQVTESV